MSATGKLTVTELEARYLNGGTKAIKDYYRNFPVLIVFPDNGGSDSVTWTPHSSDSALAKPLTPDSEMELGLVPTPPDLPNGSIVVPIRGRKESELKVTVGRLDSSDIKLGHNTVSRTHAVFDRSNGKWTLCDFNSKNGTYVDGIELLSNKPYEIEPYREIRFGEVRTLYLDWKSLLDLCRV